MASRRLLTLVLPPVALGYGVHHGLNILESRYPPVSSESSSGPVLRTPHHPTTQHCAYIDIYSARIPLKALQVRAAKEGKDKGTSQSLQETWAQTLLNSRVLRTEASLIGLFTTGHFNPGDTGNTPGGLSLEKTPGVPRKLLNGAFAIERPPSTSSNERGLVVSWEMPPGPREFFERIARWGYPWRLMSGGRHEISISQPFFDGPDNKDQGPFVEVRFASAHDYETVPEEVVLQEQKEVPRWVGRLHRGFARLVLDSAVKELRD